MVLGCLRLWTGIWRTIPILSNAPRGRICGCLIICDRRREYGVGGQMSQYSYYLVVQRWSSQKWIFDTNTMASGQKIFRFFAVSHTGCPLRLWLLHKMAAQRIWIYPLRQCVHSRTISVLVDGACQATQLHSCVRHFAGINIVNQCYVLALRSIKLYYSYSE